MSIQPQPAVCLESDILWRPEFDRPGDGYRDFFETWLRMAKNIGQAGRPVTLFGAGFAVPGNLEACVERRYFGPLHIPALVCDDDVLAQRLRQRPAWRGVTEDFIAAQLDFNRWLRDQGPQPAPRWPCWTLLRLPSTMRPQRLPFGSNPVPVICQPNPIRNSSFVIRH